ncbi:lengsin [Pristis pectinata]|uniref:lengsin n=1 Tax=Pristis pectinata TaxID=685728 RepID=UPI00223D81CE|nr:lengsin [Pristis pectinata]
MGETTDGTDEVDGSGVSSIGRKRGVRVSGKYMPPLDWERVEMKHAASSPGHSHLHRPGLSIVTGTPTAAPAQPAVAEEQVENGKQEGNSKKEEKSEEEWETGSANEEAKTRRIFVSKTGISKDTIEELKALLKESPLVTSRQKASSKSSLPQSVAVKNWEEKSKEEAGKPAADSKAYSETPGLQNGQKPSEVSAKDEPPTRAVETPHVQIQENANVKPSALISSALPGRTDGRLESKHDPALSSHVPGSIKELVPTNNSTLSQVGSMIEQVKQQITREDIRFIRFEASDLNGISRSKTIPARFFQEKVLHGVPIPRGYLEQLLSSKENEADSNYHGDILLMPDIATFRVLPWAEKTARVICDSCSVTSRPLLTDPRQVAKLQLDQLRALGFALRSSFTYEFCLYTFAQALDAPATFPAATLLNNHHQGFVQELIEGMYGAGVDIESFSSSWGPGQMEVTLRAEFGMGAADNAFAFRTGVKELAKKHEHAASFFMPLGFANLGPLSHGLWDAGGRRNLFCNKPGAAGLSALGQRWLAGLLQHAAALSCLVAPGVRCRKWRGPGPREGVVQVTCGSNDNTCAFNTKWHGGSGAHLENRLASAVANPYIVLAATVAAGLDGLRAGLSEDGEQVAPTLQPAKAYTIPLQLEDALDALEQDQCIQSALGETFTQYFIAVKRFELKTQAPDGEDKYLEYFI